MKHHRGNFFGGRGTSLAEPARLIILAKNAAQVAEAEENRAGAAPTSQTILFTKMSEATADHGVASGAADGELIFPTIDVAFARAKYAIAKFFAGGLHTARELTGFVQTQVGGLERAALQNVRTGDPWAVLCGRGPHTEKRIAQKKPKGWG